MEFESEIGLVARKKKPTIQSNVNLGKKVKGNSSSKVATTKKVKKQNTPVFYVSNRIQKLYTINPSIVCYRI